MRNVQIATALPCTATLEAVLIRGDGSYHYLGEISGGAVNVLVRPLHWFRRLLRRFTGNEFGLVTTAGVNFMATDFAAGLATPRISSFNFHDSGTGTTAAAIGDTALQTQAGPTTRATGTQSNPTAGQYRSIGTIAYVSTLAITEWGVFNQAAQGGTLWDHRVFAAINVVNGDSIQYTYTLTINAGGS